MVLKTPPFAFHAFLGLAAAFMIGAFAIFVTKLNRASKIASEKNEKRFFESWILEAKEGLTSGKTSSLMLYSTSNTDAWIARFEGMPEIKNLYFDSTDLTDKGIEVISQLPNLRELVIGFGRTQVTNSGIERLSRNQALETVRLYHLDITDEGLANLSSFSKLKELTIYSDAPRKKGLTESGIRFLKKLSKLKRLEVGGGWLSEDAVAELRQALPDCNIVENVEEDNWPFKL